MKDFNKKFIDPWGTGLPEDYIAIIKDFGLEAFSSGLFPQPNRIMKRGIVFAGRDLNRIARAIKNHEKYYVLTGIMPSSTKIHLGNKLVIEQMKYFQEHGAETYMLVADLEASATRKINGDEARKNALNYHIPAYIALGLNPKKTKFYFQSQNRSVISLTFTLSYRATLNEYKGIYGSIDPPRILSSILQVADILYPQLNGRMPGIIPVGIDQDPHLRLTRDIASRTKEHNFVLPSSIYHKYTPALDGSLKMSKSEQNYIELPDTDENIEKKLRVAFSGGRESIEKQKKLGGQPEKCVIFELYKQHFIEDDKQLQKIFQDCKRGKLLCKECKEKAILLAKKFMSDFRKKFQKAQKQVSSIKFIEN